MRQSGKVVGGVLLVAGTAIGAGMLALPTFTGLAGFYPSLLLLFAYWIYMTCTAFLMLEVNLWMNKDSNLISMARDTIGVGGQFVSWITYLFLLYALTTAYLAGSGSLFLDFFQNVMGVVLPNSIGPIPLLTIFGFFVYKGTKYVDYVNRLLMMGIVIAYLILVFMLTPHVKESFLEYKNWKFLTLSVSIVATSFGFHIVIPTLTTYLERDVRLLKKVLWIGCLIPLIVYILWELFCLGILPVQGGFGIAHGFATGKNGAELLALFLGKSWIGILAALFAFFAIVTSFLGVSLSLTDFLADGLEIKKTRSGRVLLYVLTFAPPLVITLMDPRAFLSALDYAGAFGVVILLGLLPALMAWSGRYYKHFTSSFTVPGGKLTLIMIILCSLFIIAIEICNKVGIMEYPLN